MRICTLASGSRGNCIYIDGADGAILIDDGLSLRETVARLHDVGLDERDIRAVLITHEHIDHVKGVGMLSSKLGVEVYSPHECYLAFAGKAAGVRYAGENPHYENGFSIYGYDIKPFRTPHDSVYSVGYRISVDDKTVAVATDLGTVTQGVARNLTGVNLAVIEANHDIDMLMNGRYPAMLKQRILGSCGHLSNVDMAREVARLAEGGTDKFILAHLSEDNNLPALAYNEADEILHGSGFDSGALTIEVARQHKPSRIIEI